MEGDFVAFIGGTETYGKFIDMPFPSLIEVDSGLRCVNLGFPNAGIDGYQNDPTLMEICGRARVTVVQVMGAQNMSNRFYSVHPRRNDRFVRASDLMQNVFPEVDFTDFSFTRHLLTSLAEMSPEKFSLVAHDLREAWVARMKQVLTHIDGKVVLLWVSEHAPPPEPELSPNAQDPMFVDREMLDALSDAVAHTVEVVGSAAERKKGLDEMFFHEFELPAAEEMLGPVVHRRVSEALVPVLKGLY